MKWWKMKETAGSSALPGMKAIVQLLWWSRRALEPSNLSGKFVVEIASQSMDWKEKVEKVLSSTAFSTCVRRASFAQPFETLRL